MKKQHMIFVVSTVWDDGKHHFHAKNNCCLRQGAVLEMKGENGSFRYGLWHLSRLGRNMRVFFSNKNVHLTDIVFNHKHMYMENAFACNKEEIAQLQEQSQINFKKWLLSYLIGLVSGKFVFYLIFSEFMQIM